MAVNRYDTPAQAKFMNTYVPVPFEQLYTLGKEAKADVDTAVKNMQDQMEKWYDFQSPSDVDMQSWYNETFGRFAPTLEDITTNPDRIKTVEGRAAISSAINNIDRAKLMRLKQSRDNMIKGQDFRAQLAAKGQYDPEWHNVDWSNYNSLGESGIFDDISPVAYQSIQQLADPYLKNIKDSFLYQEGGYDYFGVRDEEREAVIDQNITGILKTPEAQMHIQQIMRRDPNLTRDEAIQVFRDTAVRDTAQYTRVNREANEFSKLAAQEGYRKARSGSKSENDPDLFTAKVDNLLNTRIPANPETGFAGMPSTVDVIKYMTNPESDYYKSYLSNPDKRAAADSFNNAAFVNIGGNARYLAESEFGPKYLMSSEGTMAYPATGKPGFTPIRMFADTSMGVDANNANYTPEEKEFAIDLITGKIPRMAAIPTDKVTSTGSQSFVQQYDVAVPIQYFVDKGMLGLEYNAFFNAAKLDYTIPEEREKAGDYLKKLRKNKKLMDFMEKTGARFAGSTGNLLSGSGTNLDHPVDMSAHSGMYILVPAAKEVANNAVTREAANQAEFLGGNLGTSANVDWRRENVINSYFE